MSFPYKNPIANSTLSAPEGVAITSTQGTNFSVSQVGGYQEVYYLENLGLAFSGTGLQQLSANTVPIQINVGTNTGLSFTQLTLNSDNISSGRRRLGMQVYVYENDTVYQYNTAINSLNINNQKLFIDGEVTANGNFVAETNAYVDGSLTVLFQNA